MPPSRATGRTLPCALTGQISPRVVAVFEEVFKATVTELRLTILPADAEVRLDGARVPASGLLQIAGGDHTLSVSQIGFRAVTQPFTAVAGAATVADALSLERVASVFSFVTAVASLSVSSNQPGTLVLVDGLQRGVAPLMIPDVCEGQHLVELKSQSGRYFQRVEARTGAKITVEGTRRRA